MRKLTLAEAWEEAARISKAHKEGLCYSIGGLERHHRVTSSIRRKMQDAIAKARRRMECDRPYLWPVSPTGQVARTCWTKKQAAKARAAAKKRRKR